jgi:hypothetical protein
MSYVASRIREARSALQAAQHRRAIQLCEQARANERPTDAQLAEIFGLLGVAHAALGEHETALAFLKRADRSLETLAAAKDAYRELGLEGDPAAVFERGEARGRRRRRERIAYVVVALLVSPFLVGCCICFGSDAWVGAVGGLLVPGMERMREAQEAGAEAGRGATVATCEDTFMTGLASCSDETATEDLAPCAYETIFHQGCLSTAGGWDEFCADLAPPEVQELTARWAQQRCEARAAERGVAGERAGRFVRSCTTSVTMLAYYCRSPDLRPRETDGLDYDDSLYE